MGAWLSVLLWSLAAIQAQPFPVPARDNDAPVGNDAALLGAFYYFQGNWSTVDPPVGTVASPALAPKWTASNNCSDDKYGNDQKKEEKPKGSSRPNPRTVLQADDKKDENGKDKRKTNDDNDKMGEFQKILQCAGQGKMKVDQPQAKSAEKAEKKDGDKDNKDKDDKDDKGKDDKDKDDNGKDDKDKDKEENKRKLLPEGWNFHAQTTIIPSLDPGFGAKYSGPNSLGTRADRQATITSDLYLGAPLSKDCEFHADLLMWQGFGLNNSFGLENFPNADAFKSGTATPRFMFSRLFVRQTLGLGGEQEDVPDGPLTLAGKRDVSRLTITTGRFSPADILDNNTYNHDPHTQFMNYAGTMLNWDFPSDTVGYSTGIAIELNEKDWAVRFGWLQMPATPNGFTSDDRIFMWPVEPGDRTTTGEFWKQWGMILELERRWRIADHPGAIRLSSWLEQGHWASYKQATALLLANPPDLNMPQGVEANIPIAAFGFHYKHGFGLNWEQEIAKNVGLFGRLGWQDGQTAPAAFNDSNWTVQLGLSVKGAAWCRPGDTFGLCGNLAGASSAQQAFLKAGGMGIQDGDGNLTYAPETSLETYYDFAIGKGFHFALDYQFFANPAFNRDRGPVNVFQGRLHWEY